MLYARPGIERSLPELPREPDLAAALRPRTEEEVLRAARLDRFGGALVRSGGLWHTTHPSRFEAILHAEAILPEPPIPESARWYSGRGVEHGPLVRKLGGVSLFDFAGFPGWDEFREQFPFCSLAFFVPVHREWGAAVWIEVDRDAVRDRFLPPAELLARWKDGCLGNMVMPGVEAAYIGELPRSAFRRALHVSSGGRGSVTRVQV
jgi:hypothetical protein